MSTGAKAVNYLSMALGGAVGLGVGYVIYRRTMARAAELAREDIGAGSGLAEEGQGGGYEDADSLSSATLMDPEDAAVLMSDDDISLWERGEEGAYHDDEDEDDEEEDDEVRKKTSQD